MVGDNYYVGKNTLSDGDILITKFGDSEQYRVHETGELSGVYYVNQGYCQFRQIEVLYKTRSTPLFQTIQQMVCLRMTILLWTQRI